MKAKIKAYISLLLSIIDFLLTLNIDKFILFKNMVKLKVNIRILLNIKA